MHYSFCSAFCPSNKKTTTVPLFHIFNNVCSITASDSVYVSKKTHKTLPYVAFDKTTSVFLSKLASCNNTASSFNLNIYSALFELLCLFVSSRGCHHHHQEDINYMNTRTTESIATTIASTTWTQKTTEAIATSLLQAIGNFTRVAREFTSI